MTCKYLKSKAYRMPQEVGGSMHPEFVNMPDCELGRLNNVGAIVGEVAGCESIESNGPCWWWLQEKGNQPDTAFLGN